MGLSGTRWPLARGTLPAGIRTQSGHCDDVKVLELQLASVPRVWRRVSWLCVQAYASCATEAGMKDVRAGCAACGWAWRYIIRLAKGGRFWPVRRAGFGDVLRRGEQGIVVGGGYYIEM